MPEARPTLPAETREIIGKKVARLRDRGRLPGVIYGKEFVSSPVSVPTREFRRLYHEVGGNTLVTLQVGEHEHPVLIHEPARHPVTGEELHVDFYRVRMTDKITAEVPLRFSGEAPAVRALDGTLIRPRDSLEVICLPADLPHDLEVSLELLIDFEAAIYLKDIQTPAGVELTADPEELIAKVEPPRSEEELEELETPTVEAEAEAIESIEEAEEKPTEEEGATEETAESK